MISRTKAESRYALNESQAFEQLQAWCSEPFQSIAQARRLSLLGRGQKQTNLY